MGTSGNAGDGPDLRKTPRRQFHYAASVLTDAKTPPRPCTISEISQSGARLVLAGDGEIPEHFVLLLTKNGDARRHCRVAWREGSTVGVNFTGSQS